MKKLCSYAQMCLPKQIVKSHNEPSGRIIARVHKGLLLFPFPRLFNLRLQSKPYLEGSPKKTFIPFFTFADAMKICQAIINVSHLTTKVIL